MASFDGIFDYDRMFGWGVHIVVFYVAYYAGLMVGWSAVRLLQGRLAWEAMATAVLVSAVVCGCLHRSVHHHWAWAWFACAFILWEMLALMWAVVGYWTLTGLMLGMPAPPPPRP